MVINNKKWVSFLGASLQVALTTTRTRSSWGWIHSTNTRSPSSRLTHQSASRWVVNKQIAHLSLTKNKGTVFWKNGADQKIYLFFYRSPLNVTPMISSPMSVLPSTPWSKSIQYLGVTQNIPTNKSSKVYLKCLTICNNMQMYLPK